MNLPARMINTAPGVMLALQYTHISRQNITYLAVINMQISYESNISANPPNTKKTLLIPTNDSKLLYYVTYKLKSTLDRKSI